MADEVERLNKEAVEVRNLLAWSARVVRAHMPKGRGDVRSLQLEMMKHIDAAIGYDDVPNGNVVKLNPKWDDGDQAS